MHSFMIFDLQNWVTQVSQSICVILVVTAHYFKSILFLGIYLINRFGGFYFCYHLSHISVSVTCFDTLQPLEGPGHLTYKEICYL